jgi:SPP1 gp7 family putative phage head morphogenesis protein
LAAILKQTKIDSFESLKAISESDIDKGLFSDRDIEKLRTILKEGFRKNQKLKEIETNIKQGINIKDRLTEDGKTIPSETRAESIARTETLRLSGQAIKSLYQDNDINKYQFLSSPGACDICQGLDDGTVRLLSEAQRGVNYPDMHPNCRCFPMAVR